MECKFYILFFWAFEAFGEQHYQRHITCFLSQSTSSLRKKIIIMDSNDK